MTYILSLSQIDVCLSCYLTDHHNRDNELLVGVPVNGTTTYDELMEALELELQQSDKLPDDLDAELIDNTVADMFKDIVGTDTFDSSLEPPGENDNGEGPQVWFLLKWEKSS